MEYKATLDLKSKIITGFVGVLFLVIAVYNFKLIDLKAGDTTQTTILTLTTVLIVSIFIFCYLYRPLKYVVDKNKVIVKRPMKDLIIDFNNIKDVFLPTKESMKWTIRTFGNGGLFGYFGSFRNGTHGGMTWYATKTSNYLIIVTKDNDKIVLTPDDTGMIDEIKK
jgi:hypothetical protein